MSELIGMPYGTGKTVGIWRTICLPSYPPQYRYECSKCSVCSKEMSNYCPYCGAEMQLLEKGLFETYSEVQLDVEMDSRKKIYKNKCRYCGGDLEMYTHEDRNIIGEQGYSIELKCDSCKSKASLFSNRADMIQMYENKLLEIYGIKGE